MNSKRETWTKAELGEGRGESMEKERNSETVCEIEREIQEEGEKLSVK